MSSLTMHISDLKIVECHPELNRAVSLSIYPRGSTLLMLRVINLKVDWITRSNLSDIYLYSSGYMVHRSHCSEEGNKKVDRTNPANYWPVSLTYDAHVSIRPF